MSVRQNLTASRNATWAPTLVYTYQGAQLPLIGAHIAMQLRLYPGAAGDALLEIDAIPFTDTHVSGVPGASDEQRSLMLEPSFTPMQLETLPGLNQPEAGAAQSFSFDLRITYVDSSSEILASGTFSIDPGVTTA